jgi:hypothetical protein
MLSLLTLLTVSFAQGTNNMSCSQLFTQQALPNNDRQALVNSDIISFLDRTPSQGHPQGWSQFVRKSYVQGQMKLHPLRATKIGFYNLIYPLGGIFNDLTRVAFDPDLIDQSIKLARRDTSRLDPYFAEFPNRVQMPIDDIFSEGVETFKVVVYGQRQRMSHSPRTTSLPLSMQAYDFNWFQILSDFNRIKAELKYMLNETPERIEIHRYHPGGELATYFDDSLAISLLEELGLPTQVFVYTNFGGDFYASSTPLYTTPPRSAFPITPNTPN